MHLNLNAQQAGYLQQILARAMPQLRDTPTFAPMIRFLKDLHQRLARGEREFSFDAKEARYLRRIVRAARTFLERQATTPSGAIMKAQLALGASLFEYVLRSNGTSAS